MFWSFRLGMHFSFLFALHKSLSGVLGGTCKHLGSKREWKVLFERVEHRSRQWERPTTPDPDETKVARPLAAGFGTRSKPTPRWHLSRMGATKTERGPQVRSPRAKRRNEVAIRSDFSQRGEAPAPSSTSRRQLSRSGATMGSEVRNPRAKTKKRSWHSERRPASGWGTRSGSRATSHTHARSSYSDRKFMFYLGLSGCWLTPLGFRSHINTI